MFRWLFLLCFFVCLLVVNLFVMLLICVVFVLFLLNVCFNLVFHVFSQPDVGVKLKIMISFK